MTLQEFLDEIDWLMPGRAVTGLFSDVSTRLHGIERFCGQGGAVATGNFSEMVTPPDLDPELCARGQTEWIFQHQGLSHLCAAKAHVELRDFAVLE